MEEESSYCIFSCLSNLINTNISPSCLQSSLKRLSYLLDVHSFPPSDLSLNQTVLTWPAKIPAIFEAGERIVEESKTRGEASLREKQEKVVIEIEKVKTFNCLIIMAER